MLGQAKTVHQAEIDAACEIIDFLRFNVSYAEQIYGKQPVIDAASGTAWTIGRSKASSRDHAVQLHAIADNLPTAPAIMGNATSGSRRRRAMLRAWYISCSSRGGSARRA